MNQQREPLEQVSHVIGLYHRGVLGPSAMWLGIADLLTPASAIPLLNSLREEAQEQLLAAYCGLPPHAYIARTPAGPGDEDFQTVCVQIVRWCEARRPLDRPSEVDGLVRVFVEDGVVKVWRPQESSSSSQQDSR